MAKTVIVNCKCISPYQDAVYGKSKRLANVKGDSKIDATTATCTVCAKEHIFRKINEKK